MESQQQQPVLVEPKTDVEAEEKQSTCGPDADDSSTSPNSSDIAICGAGIVGLVTALALNKHAGIQPVLYEQAPAFHAGVGAAVGKLNI